MRFFRLTPLDSRRDAAPWQRSTERQECCIAACCEADARRAASTLFQAGPADDGVSPWLLDHLVTCAPVTEVPAVTTDPRLAPAQRAALQLGTPTEVPALAARDGAKPLPLPGTAAEAKLVQALAALAEAFRSVGHAEAGERMLATVAQTWSEIAPPGPAAAAGERASAPRRARRERAAERLREA